MPLLLGKPNDSAQAPDIAAQAQAYAVPLNWVGMCGIALPVQFERRTAAAKSMQELAW
jgi:GTP cyclohydrolase FolE2